MVSEHSEPEPEPQQERFEGEADLMYHGMMQPEEVALCRRAFEETVDRNTKPSAPMMYLALDYLSHRVWSGDDVMVELRQLMQSTRSSWSQWMRVNPHAARQLREYVYEVVEVATAMEMF